MPTAGGHVMRTNLLCVGGFIAFSGCVSLPRNSPVVIHNRDVALYQAGIVRPGMTKSEVDKILGSPGQPYPYVVGGQFTGTVEVDYTDLVVEYDSLFVADDGRAKVVKCRTARPTEEGREVASFTDAELRDVLHAGMSPTDVTRRIGSPFGGYENEPGKVAMVHPQPGIEVIYESGRLKEWRRHHVYLPARSAGD